MSGEIPKYGYRDDSDAGIAGDLGPETTKKSLARKWTLEEVSEVARAMGKKFQPNPSMVDRLKTDLASGALVLFTPEQVNQAIELGLVPTELKEDLSKVVDEEGDNDIIVINQDDMKQWKVKQLFLS